MNTLSLNNLWSYLQGLALTASNKKWLADHLYESAKAETSEAKTREKLQVTKEDFVLSSDVLEPVRNITPLPADFDFDKAREEYLMKKYG